MSEHRGNTAPSPVALVTGGGGGLGSVIARELDREGARVVVAGRRLAALESTAADLRDATTLQLDVADQEGWRAGVDEIERSVGPVGVLVTSAGIIERASFVESDPLDWERMWRTNVHGSMLGVHTVLPGMLRRGEGRIVLVSSITAAVGCTGRSAYGATKGALEAFCRGVAAEIAGSGVTINCLAPGAFMTPLNEDHFISGSPALAETLQRIPEARFGTSEDIGSAVTYLVRNGYSQGTVLRVDGGWSST